MKRTLTALIYARYSPRPRRRFADAAKQAEHDKARTEEQLKDSCDVQIADLRAHCAIQGYAVDESLIFRDDALSGEGFKKRKDMKRLLRFLRKRKSARGYIVVCRDTKRLGRNMLDTFCLLRRITRRGCFFETLSAGRFDESDPMRFGWFGFDAIMAHVDRLTIKKNTKAKMLGYQRGDGGVRPRRMSDIPPVGWMVAPDDDRYLDPNHDEQSTIDVIWSLRVETGLSLRKTIAELEKHPDERHRLNRGVHWNVNAIRRIVKREAVRRAVRSAG